MFWNLGPDPSLLLFYTFFFSHTSWKNLVRVVENLNVFRTLLRSFSFWYSLYR
jgi:hypothetical protein